MKRGQRSIPRRVLPRAGCRPAPRARAYAQISDLRSEARATLQRSLSRVGCRPAPYRAYIPVRMLRCHMSDLRTQISDPEVDLYEVDLYGGA